MPARAVHSREIHLGPRFRGPEARVGTLDTRNLHLISVTIDWAGDSDALASILSLHRHNDIIE